MDASISFKESQVNAPPSFPYKRGAINCRRRRSKNEREKLLMNMKRISAENLRVVSDSATYENSIADHPWRGKGQGRDLVKIIVAKEAALVSRRLGPES